MEKKVEREVREYMQVPAIAEELKRVGVTDPEDRFYHTFMSYSNNFWFKIGPSGDQRMWRENEASDPGFLDRPLGPDIRKGRKHAREHPDHYHQIPKSVLERRTIRQFIEDINRVTQEVGLNEEKYVRIMEGEDRSTESNLKIGRMLLPVYIKLREMGYSHRDLD